MNKKLKLENNILNLPNEMLLLILDKYIKINNNEKKICINCSRINNFSKISKKLFNLIKVNYKNLMNKCLFYYHFLFNTVVENTIITKNNIYNNQIINIKNNNNLQYINCKFINCKIRCNNLLNILFLGCEFVNYSNSFIKVNDLIFKNSRFVLIKSCKFTNTFLELNNILNINILDNLFICNDIQNIIYGSILMIYDIFNQIIIFRNKFNLYNNCLNQYAMNLNILNHKQQIDKKTNLSIVENMVNVYNKLDDVNKIEFTNLFFNLDLSKINILNFSKNIYQDFIENCWHIRPLYFNSHYFFDDDTHIENHNGKFNIELLQGLLIARSSEIELILFNNDYFLKNLTSLSQDYNFSLNTLNILPLNIIKDPKKYDLELIDNPDKIEYFIDNLF